MYTSYCSIPDVVRCSLSIQAGHVPPGSLQVLLAAGPAPCLDQLPALLPLLDGALLGRPDADGQSHSSLSRFEMPGPHPLSSATSAYLLSRGAVVSLFSSMEVEARGCVTVCSLLRSYNHLEAHYWDELPWPFNRALSQAAPAWTADVFPGGSSSLSKGSGRSVGLISCWTSVLCSLSSARPPPPSSGWLPFMLAELVSTLSNNVSRILLPVLPAQRPRYSPSLTSQ